MAGGGPSRPAAWMVWVVAVLGCYGMLAAASFTAAGAVAVRSTVLHQPFVAALAAAAGLATLVAWTRLRIDRSSQSFLITVAFGALAILYAPHALLESDRPDPVHLLYGPVSRLAFAVLLAVAFLGVRIPARLLAARWPVALAAITAAIAIDVLIHSQLAASSLGAEPVVVLRRIEAAAIAVQGLAAAVVGHRWRRDRAPFLTAVGAALTALAVGSVLFLTTTPWLGRWWIAHLGLLVCAVCLVLGILGERSRTGRLAGVAALDRLPLLAEHVVEATSDGVAVHDATGRLVGWNPAAVTLTGWSRQDAARSFPRDRDGLVDLGGGCWINIRRTTVRRYGVTYTVAVFRDARAEVELRATRDALAAQQLYLTEVLDAIDITVITCDTTGTIVHANRAAQQVLAAAPGTLTVAEATTLVDMRHPDGTPVAEADIPMIRALGGEDVADFEAIVPSPDGSHHVIMVHARPLHGTSGNITGAVASSYTITALRQHQREIAAFAGVVAHDLNSPLAAVTGYLALARDSLTTGPTQDLDAVRRDLDSADAAATRMRRLITDLLAYTSARDARLRLTDVDLRALVHDVVTGRLNDSNAHPSPDQPPPDIHVGHLPPVHADTVQIRQLIDNLIGNALKYTPPGRPAHVEITAETDQPGSVRIDVADHGIGIPDGQHHAIFTGFHRAHPSSDYPGTGLGLAICHHIVTRHGGTITATDNPGGGARFSFTLPTAHQPHHPPAPTRHPAHPPSTR
jgi:signal transduction histidine kinase